MTKKLRPFQRDFLNELLAKVNEHGHVIAQSPTGSGKTVMIKKFVEHRLKSRTCLVFTESKKIFGQLMNELGGIPIHAETKNFVLFNNRVYVAMAQTFQRRKKIIEKFKAIEQDLDVIIDEAHIGTSNNALKNFNGVRIGFTATPAYKWAKYLPELYNEIVCGLQVEDLIIQGFLNPYQHKGRNVINEDKLQVKGGDFTENSQEIVFSEKGVFEAFVKDLKETKYTKGIVYTASIKACEDLYNALNLIGIKCGMFHSEFDGSQKHLSEFHGNEFDLLITVAALTKGYDFDKLDLCVLYRATTSLPLYLQMIGRIGRVYEGKTTGTCLDYGNNFKRFGFWDASRDWAELWKKGQDKSDQMAPTKQCPQCESFLAASLMICKFCGYAFQVKEKKVSVGDLEDFRDDYTKLIGKRVYSLKPEELALYASTKNMKKEAIRIAMSIRQIQKIRDSYVVKYKDGTYPEMKRGNYLQRFGFAMGYKDSWYKVQTGALDDLTRKGDIIFCRNFILK